MTDVMRPDRIWYWRRFPNENFKIWLDMHPVYVDAHEYTRTDLAEAAERAAYLRGLEDAAQVAMGYIGAEAIVDAIYALAKEGGE